LLEHGTPVKEGNKPSSITMKANSPAIAVSNAVNVRDTCTLALFALLSYSRLRCEMFVYLKWAMSRLRRFSVASKTAFPASSRSACISSSKSVRDGQMLEMQPCRPHIRHCLIYFLALDAANARVRRFFVWGFLAGLDAGRVISIVVSVVSLMARSRSILWSFLASSGSCW
jgi:hypothetical protein